MPMIEPPRTVTGDSQQPDIPDAWELVAEWDTPERHKLELYASASRGRVLAIYGPYGPEVAAEITGTRKSPRVEWAGTFTRRGREWQAAQAAIIRAHLAEARS